MKPLIASLLICAAAASARAQGLPDDVYSVNLAEGSRLVKLFEQKTMVCVPSDEEGYKKTEKGTYPLKLSAETQGNQVLVTVRTADPKVGYGFGGNDFSLEFSRSQILLSIGDDGRRYLHLSYYEGFTENECTKNRNGQYEGDLPAVVADIWDAGHITTHGLQCCFE